MDENFLFENNNTVPELFSEEEYIPTEKNPFCNYSENISYKESYSDVIPTFFFRNNQLSLKPSRYESAKLRYFYNLCGTILISGTFVKTIIFLVFYAIVLMHTCSQYNSINSTAGFFRQFISNPSIRYSLLSIATIISALFIFKTGCRFSKLRTCSFFRNNHSAKTSEIISFFMTGIFITSIYNVIYLAKPFIPEMLTVSRPVFSTDILQSLLFFMYTCLVVPVCEGFVFRGFILKNMSRADQRFGIIFTSFLCAISCGNFLEIIPGFMMSLLLCKITTKYGTLSYPIIMHITINICNTIILAYGDIFFNSNIFVLQIWTAITFMSGGFFAIYSFFKEPLPKSTKPQRKRSVKLILRTVTILPLIVLYIFLMSANTL